jgi:hypothetical protein
MGAVGGGAEGEGVSSVFEWGFQAMLISYRTRGFDLLEKMAKQGVIKAKKKEEKVNLAEIAAAVCLSFFDVRQVEWRGGRDGLETFYQSWEMRESFVRAISTREADWKRAKL